MKLYNTLTKAVEEIKPASQSAVTIYTCGPTVYDYAHIGNWFTFIRYDLLVRALKQSKYEPKWVLNITDVGHLTSDADEGEDKLQSKATKEHKTAWEIADYYTDYFLKGLKKLNISKPTYLPKATDHIKEQIEIVEQLETKGYTYKTNDGIYFDTSKFKDYGKLTQLETDEISSKSRIGSNPEKRNDADFALWKFSPKDKQRDMEWDSPWGKGFPGWHLECSAMALKYLGETIDIHAGGIDHIPVHHTNEIAQTEAITGKPLASIWMHTNHIAVDGEKIAKSAGNGLTLEALEEKGYSANDLRYLILQSHYRSQSQFSWNILEEAKTSLNNLTNDLSWVYHSSLLSDNINPDLEPLLSEYKERILSAIQSDLNSPMALSALHELANRLSNMPLSQLDAPTIEQFAASVDELLGLKVIRKDGLTVKQQKVFDAREKARLDKHWDESDKLRGELKSHGIGVRDTSNGTIWYHL